MYSIAYKQNNGNVTIVDSSEYHAIYTDWRMLTINYDATNNQVQFWFDDNLDIEMNLSAGLNKGTGIVVNAFSASNSSPDGMPDVTCKYRSLTFFDHCLSKQEIRGLAMEYDQ
jgi:hypothetical protein